MDSVPVTAWTDWRRVRDIGNAQLISTAFAAMMLAAVKSKNYEFRTKNPVARRRGLGGAHWHEGHAAKRRDRAYHPTPWRQLHRHAQRQHVPPRRKRRRRAWPRSAGEIHVRCNAGQPADAGAAREKSLGITQDLLRPGNPRQHRGSRP